MTRLTLGSTRKLVVARLYKVKLAAKLIKEWFSVILKGHTVYHMDHLIASHYDFHTVSFPLNESIYIFYSYTPPPLPTTPPPNELDLWVIIFVVFDS